jgi:hypothetical protein
MPSGVYIRTKYIRTKPAWNKGKVGVESEESRKKRSDLLKERGVKPVEPFRWTGKKRPPFSKEWKKKLSDSHKGQTSGCFKLGLLHPNWNGGTSFEPYTTDWTVTLKRSICERDNYICQVCSQYGNTVHHIDYDKKNCNPNNLITLCKSCHPKTNRNRDCWRKAFEL